VLLIQQDNLAVHETKSSLMQSLTSIKPGTRVLMANFPADGHFQPLTGIAVYLKSIGCDVRWYTSVKYQDKINKLGIHFYGLQSAMDFGADPDIDKVFPERSKYKSQVGKLKFDLVHAFILRGPEYYVDLKNIYNEFAFEVLIADIAFTGIPFVKDLMKIPVAGVSVFPLPETSKDLAPMGLGIPPSNSALGKLKQSLLRFIADKVLFAHPNKVMRETLKKYGIDTGNLGIFDVGIKFSTIVLQSGTPGFEYYRSDMSSHVHFVGPLLPYSKISSDKKWFDPKLKEYSKVVLITQGTVERDVTKLIIPALEAFKDSDVLVIVTTGGSDTDKIRKQYPYRNIIIEDYIPFNEVMPYSDVYITNGGYGGVLLSFQNGLPIVGAGIHEGKNEINARIGYLKLGINCKTERPSPDQLKKAVYQVLDNPIYKQNVKTLCTEFKTYDSNKITLQLLGGITRQTKRHSLVSEEASIY
jgi:UDP:flavonoid glycosyltransferase YjiC (YdhE family)